ncbi:DEAD/DEAH box helicase family protein (plasmid) [Mycobacterium marinum]|uniref:DEAD/DEAH box helicase family protein n=1 Tax=Mycobacterium marinum TaxID=1781 RepID=UPI00045FE6FD|nr:DEAD/DEAH box helicase family protein [Mycobacterium marinum]WCS21241.1 DEAD/DEAH box helicase family protein [Mycobacterium marinum]WOR07497.1 DEAD/DEAH box helicase family protein [Mycobacterium marinum]GJO51740.1 hypothetical protein NJB1604_39830 [Mycobacterium marinum]CDM79516.1 hypothetical protein MMARE11_p00130 [Mycobacterium marinum E11]
MAFARAGRRQPVPADPEALYRQLARTNNGPNSLWGHQTDILREWHENYVRKRDVALELPTGAGKTLVGGLIAEWLRQSEQQPVGYLCPNRQLAVQAAERLREYGIPTSLLIGRINRWNPIQRADFTSAEAVAVSVYHHVFNTNPGIAGAATLLFDDAHAGEQPVASAWSITVKRQEAAYQSVLSVLADALDPAVVASLREDHSIRKHGRDVFLASPAVVTRKASELEHVLNDAVATGQLDEHQSYPLSTLAGHIGRCTIYISHRGLLIRPLISPTESHPAFADAQRRVYMSATLGSGGELERAFGRRKVHRMPVPRGWDKQGTGRRFFVFPQLTKELSQDDKQLAPWLKNAILDNGRAALLTPSDHQAEALLAAILPQGHIQLDGHAVEKDMSMFTNTPNAVLNLANRYDGVDLPDDACRLLILAGLPAHGDLQEHFLYDELGAGAVLQERIRARIIQGSGRATRNAKDYATVVVIGDNLTNFVIRPDVLGALRQELQAEIEFGRTQSLGQTIDDIDENIGWFRDQTDEWLDAEAEITADRDDRERTDPPATAELAAAAPAEVAAMDAWWDGDLEKALEHAQTVIGALAKCREAQRYAALWLYLAACWTRILADQQGDTTGTLGRAAQAFISQARTAGRGTTWLSYLVGSAAAITGADGYDDLDRLAAQTIAKRIATWKDTYEKGLTAAKAGLAQTQWKKYEVGLTTLGWFAGATDVYNSGGEQAAPDSIWIFPDKLWVAWEAKSEADPNSSVSAKYAREASSHLRFIAKKRQEQPPVGSFTAFPTPQSEVSHAARAVCEDDVYLVPAHAAAELLAALERAWTKARTLSSAVDEASVLSALKAAACLPSQWMPQLTRQRLNKVGADDVN